MCDLQGAEGSARPVPTNALQRANMHGPTTFKLCTHFTNGQCGRAAKCTFAHSQEELVTWNAAVRAQVGQFFPRGILSAVQHCAAPARAARTAPCAVCCVPVVCAHVTSRRFAAWRARRLWVCVCALCVHCACSVYGLCTACVWRRFHLRVLL